MNYYDYLNFTKYTIVFVLNLMFLFFIISKANSKFSIFMFCALFYTNAVYLTTDFESLNYIDRISWSAKVDGVIAAVCCSAFIKDKLARAHALLLSFAVLTNSVLILYYADSISYSYYVWLFYDEIIIAIGIAQIMASYDRFMDSFRDLREFLHRFNFVFICNTFAYSRKNKELKQ